MSLAHRSICVRFLRTYLQGVLNLNIAIPTKSGKFFREIEIKVRRKISLIIGDKIVISCHVLIEETFELKSERLVFESFGIAIRFGAATTKLRNQMKFLEKTCQVGSTLGFVWPIS